MENQDMQGLFAAALVIFFKFVTNLKYSNSK